MKLDILILEDDINRVELFNKNLAGHNVVHVETVDDCIKQAEENFFHFMLLDHDLGGEVYVESGGDTPTGWDFAKWLSDELKTVKVFRDNGPLAVFVHSLNPDGRKNILNKLNDSGKSKSIGFAEAPFIWQKENLSETLIELFNKLTTKH